MNKEIATLQTPVVATITSSRGKYNSHHYTLWIHSGGITITNRRLTNSTVAATLEVLQRFAANQKSGHSGNRRTQNPKHHWSEFSVPSDTSDDFIKEMFGTTLQDEVNRRFIDDEYVLYAKKYCLPHRNLSRFIRSRHRDKTWCDCLRLHQTNGSIAAYIRSLKGEQIDDVWGVFSLNVPTPANIPRRIWKCAECGAEGNYEAFNERSIPGLAGSTGLNCPNCKTRKVSPEIELLSGQPRGDVRPIESEILFPVQ